MTNFKTIPINRQPRNVDFVSVLFSKKNEDEMCFACTFPQSPTSREANWSGYTTQPNEVSDFENSNAYISTASFQPNSKARNLECFAALHFVVLDDVKNTPLKPTYKLETSSDNFQIGFKLAQPLRDKEIARRLLQSIQNAGLESDRSGNNPVRWVRLAVGLNTKYQPHFHHQIVSWNPEVAYTLDELTEGLGLDRKFILEGEQRAKDQLGLDGFKNALGGDYASLIRDVVTQENIHEPTVRLAAKMIGSGVPAHVATEYIQGLLNVVPNEQDERWQSRFNDIPRIVKTAVEKFSPEVRGNVDPQTGEWLAPDDGGEIPISREMQAVNWVLEDNIPEGIGLIAGAAGVGKTTAIAPLACIAAGFFENGSDVTAKVHRMVVIYSEDDAQLNRIFFGMLRHLEEVNGTPVDFDQFKKRVHIFPSKRITPVEMKAKSLWAVKHFSLTHPKLGEIPPLIIFDTASANFDLEDENSSSQVGKAMAALKEVYLITKAPMWIAAHLVKAAKGMTIDDLLNISARGSGAWEADCYWTAVLGRESDSSRKTILKIDKERTGGLKGHEIHFDVDFHDEYLIDALGDSVAQKYSTTSIRQGDKRSRNEAAKDRKLQDTINEMAKLLEAKETRRYMFKQEILDLMHVKSAKKSEMFNELLLEKRIKEIEVPQSEVTHHRKRVAYVLTTFGDRLGSVSGNEWGMNTSTFLPKQVVNGYA